MSQHRKAHTEHRRMFKTAFAKSLRKFPSDAERKLWFLLRDKRLGDFRFRRQQPVGPYIADFFCAPARLIIELDGDQHGSADGLARDADRTRFLKSRGYRVLRFPNGDVLKSPAMVLEAIYRAVSNPLQPSP